MTSVDLGMFGLDCFVTDKSSSSLDSDLCIEEFESLLQDSPISSQNILDMSLQQSGIADIETNNNNIGEQMEPSWDDDTDDFLKSMLNGPDLSAELEHMGRAPACPSDTSSDSGCPDDRLRVLRSPDLDDERYERYGAEAGEPQPVDLVEYISSHDTDTESLQSEVGADLAAVSPGTLQLVADPEVQTSTGTTTIILPPLGQPGPAPTLTMTQLRLTPRDQQQPAAKRRRVSASSSDSGLEDACTTITAAQVYRHQDNKYPPLELNDEELKMAGKENMKFPSHYPLTREEERNLKKIRRKIRNKLSAQDSRKRKREYVDNMEDRVKACSEENQELKDKIKALESQNKTLAAQLRRLHQIVVNGGLRQGQTSTALMVLLLSTALFLIPGFNDQKADSKSEIDIQAAVKMPPMPGQSRSLLQFDGVNNDIADLNDFQETIETVETVAASPGPGDKPVLIKVEEAGEAREPPYSDHDYTFSYKFGGQGPPPVKVEVGSAWIEEDAPPMGYGRDMVKMEEEDRHMNVNVSSSSSGQGTKTVILQIPKDIK